MEIRPATADDIDAIAAIYGHSVETDYASFELEPPSSAQMLSRWQTITDAGYPYLAAISSDGVLAGYAYASAYRPRPAYSKTVEGTVYVAPQFHAQGVGTSLLNALISASVERQYRVMVAVIAADPAANPENIASVQLHKKCGFGLAGRLSGVGHKHGLWLDVIIMQRSLHD